MCNIALGDFAAAGLNDPARIRLGGGEWSPVLFRGWVKWWDTPISIGFWTESEGNKIGEMAVFVELEYGGRTPQVLTCDKAGKVGLRLLIRSLLIPTRRSQKCLRSNGRVLRHPTHFGGPPSPKNLGTSD
jgi:hypothetical protein